MDTTEEEYAFDGHRYVLRKMGLRNAQTVLAKLTEIGFFEDGLTALMSHPDAVNSVERLLFGECAALVNEQGHEAPMSKVLTEAHFAGRVPAYFNLMVKAIRFNLEDFLAGGWFTSLEAEEETEA